MSDVVDVNMVKQGQSGYLNAEIVPGDLILRVDGRDAQRVSLQELHDLLRGARVHAIVLLRVCASLRALPPA